jgi:cephalosporin hydroxylase
MQQVEIIEQFHKLFHEKKLERSAWLGRKIIKNPFDLWVYQEIICRCKPTLIIETGTYTGASSHYLSEIMKMSGIQGKVISIDCQAEWRRQFAPNEYLEFVLGTSTDQAIFNQVKSIATDRTMVILDSDHSKNNVLRELDLYSQLVSSGQYLIVEDTNLGGNPISPEFDGPMGAVKEFLEKNNEFQVDKKCERFLFTCNPDGFLLKK